MYESFFSLSRRPFAASPDPNCFIPSEINQEAMDELIVSVERGQGIAILTAPPGMGKTITCKRLLWETHDSFQVVFLANSNYPGARALLQAVLYELGHPYTRMDEQELRLELTTAVKAVQPAKRAVVLVFDEAHLLGEELLEEIRAITNLIEHGEPLVRVILSGQLQLEDKLTHPELDAFNQRVCSQVTLQPLTRQESVEFLSHQIEWAGGKMSEVFTAEAAQLIAHASDGVPRCLNQLADHSLLLAYVAEEKPVSANTVREALNDLRQLPLHWNEPSTEFDLLGTAVPTADSEPSFVASVESAPPEFSDPAGVSPENPGENVDSFEIGADDSIDAPSTVEQSASTDAAGVGESMSDIDLPANAVSVQTSSIEYGINEDASDAPESSLEAFTSPTSQRNAPFQEDDVILDAPSGEFEEVVVEDLYALIDAHKHDSKVSGIVWDLSALPTDTVVNDVVGSASQADPAQIEDSAPAVDETPTSMDVLPEEAEHEVRNLPEVLPPVPDEAVGDDEDDALIEADSDRATQDDNQELDTRPDLIIDDILSLLNQPSEGWIYPVDLASAFLNESNTADIVRAELPAVDVEAAAYRADPGTEALHPAAPAAFDPGRQPDAPSEQSAWFASDQTPSHEDMDSQSMLVFESLNQGNSIEEQIGSEVLDICLETQQSMLGQLNSAAARPAAMDDQPETSSSRHPEFGDTIEFDVVEPEEVPRPLPLSEGPADFTSNSDSTPSIPTESLQSQTSAAVRPYQRLFSELRRRKQQS